MAADVRSGAGQRRQGSTASSSHGLPLLQRKASAASRQTTGAAAAATGPVQPVSAHLSDPSLHQFLQPDFDPAAFWNTTLSSSSNNSNNNSNNNSISKTATRGSASITAEQTVLAQDSISQLAAHTNRLTTVLTQLTDDILRSGSRLAYEVELLRGETLGLAEVLEQLGAESVEKKEGAPKEAREAGQEGDGTEQAKDAETAAAAAPAAVDPEAPPSLAQLRMLAQVRGRLDAVIHTFGDAMEFVMPPSALSVSASFLSVSGPDATGAAAAMLSPAMDPSGSSTTPGGGRLSSDGGVTSLEEKGQQVLKARRDEVARLLQGGTQKDVDAALARVDELRALCRVWTGTVEERARHKFVDGLQRLVEDRQRQLDRERQASREATAAAAAAAAAAASASASTSAASGGGGGSGTAAAAAAAGSQDAGSGTSSSSAPANTNRGYAAGYGLISQLQKIRGGL